MLILYLLCDVIDFSNHSNLSVLTADFSSLKGLKVRSRSECVIQLS